MLGAQSKEACQRVVGLGVDLCPFLSFTSWLPQDKQPSSPLAPTSLIFCLTSGSKGWSGAKTSETMSP